MEFILVSLLLILNFHLYNPVVRLILLVLSSHSCILFQSLISRPSILSILATMLAPVREAHSKTETEIGVSSLSMTTVLKGDDFDDDIILPGSQARLSCLGHG